ncbi:MAG: hypothetical protein ACM3WQ_01720 [Chloroflexota bacterium]|jgi:hypothetical protein
MVIAIPSMQAARNKRLEEMVTKDETAKRTTIILEKEERNYIDSLIEEGKEAGIKPLISKMLDVYKNLMIYDWRFPGEYYCGISRIAFVNVELIELLIQQIPKEKWRENGMRMGEALKVSMETTLGLQTANQESWKNVFDRLKVQGYGDIIKKDKYLLVKTPFISNVEIWAGLLEALFNLKLDTKATVPPLVFEIITKQMI